MLACEYLFAVTVLESDNVSLCFSSQGSLMGQQVCFS